MLTLAWGLFLLVLLAGASAVLAALLDLDAALLPLPLLSAAALVLYPFGMLGSLRIGAVLAVLAAVIAVSRVITGVHFVSDVLAGLAFGLVFAVAGRFAYIAAASALPTLSCTDSTSTASVFWPKRMLIRSPGLTS